LALIWIKTGAAVMADNFINEIESEAPAGPSLPGLRCRHGGEQITRRFGRIRYVPLPELRAGHQQTGAAAGRPLEQRSRRTATPRGTAAKISVKNNEP
jgi:hypothetical protein